MSNPTALVQKLWNYCNILRDGGLSYGDYVWLKDDVLEESANLPAPEITAQEILRLLERSDSGRKDTACQPR